MDKKPTIQELEKILNSEETTPIQILPNGEIRPLGEATIAELGSKKPLTMRENLGGEYGGNRKWTLTAYGESLRKRKSLSRM